MTSQATPTKVVARRWALHPQKKPNQVWSFIKRASLYLAMMQFTPTVVIHTSAALGALTIGPIALWARISRKQRPMLHRAFGYAWVTLMLVAAITALFIRDFDLPNFAGYTLIHLLVPLTLLGIFGAFIYLIQKNIAAHRRTMQSLYFGACVGAGIFTLLPNRLLGHLVWHQLLSRF